VHVPLVVDQVDSAHILVGPSCFCQHVVVELIIWEVHLVAIAVSLSQIFIELLILGQVKGFTVAISLGEIEAHGLIGIEKFLSAKFDGMGSLHAQNRSARA